MPLNETVVRMFQLVDEKFPEQKDFAFAIGVTPSIVSQWRNGITKSYERRLGEIADVLDTTMDYLLTGQEKKPAAGSGSELEREFMELFMRLPPEEQERELAYLRQRAAERYS